MRSGFETFPPKTNSRAELLRFGTHAGMEGISPVSPCSNREEEAEEGEEEAEEGEEWNSDDGSEADFSPCFFVHFAFISNF